MIQVPDEFREHFHSYGCLQQDDSNVGQGPDLPLVDIFINPSRAETKDKLIENYKKRAKDYFARADMKELFPNLFRILWYSSLPCTEQPGFSQQFLLKTCTLAGKNVSCSDMFTKVVIFSIAKLSQAPAMHGLDLLYYCNFQPSLDCELQTVDRCRGPSVFQKSNRMGSNKSLSLGTHNLRQPQK